MEFMTELMEKMMVDLAKKEDIHQLKVEIDTEIKKTKDKVGALTTSVGAAHKNIDTVDDMITSLEKKVKSMEETATTAPPPQMTISLGRMSTGGRRSSTASTPQIDDTWFPIIVHSRGWAPYGSNESSNISHTEAEQLHAQILDRVANDVRPRTKFLSPFMKNHSVSAEILATNYNDTKRICDLINLE